MSIFSSMEVSASALTAERQRAEVVAANIANSDTTRTAGGGPYRRKQVVFAAQSPFRMLLVGGNRGFAPSVGQVRVAQVVEDATPPTLRYEPGHPDADESGNVAYPAVNPIMEMVDMMSATRAYQLNASAVSASKQMIQQALDILK